MTISTLFTGTAGMAVSSFSSFIIVLMMFIVAFRLFVSRRKHAYLSLMLSFFVILVQYAFLFFVSLSRSAELDKLDYTAQILQTFAFILINLGVYQLYNSTKRKAMALLFGSLAAAAALAVWHGFALSGMIDPTQLQRRFLDLWLELYLILLTFLAFYWIAPHVGQRYKYQSALCIYLLVQTAHLVNLFFLQVPQPWLQVATQFLPLVFYLILFLFVFERVVELMQAIYHSSIRDGLTGLYNRQYLLQQVYQLNKQRMPFSVIFGDIDNFKRLNDTQGHHQGDLALKSVAEIFMEIGEEIGLAGRFGGEEFVLILTEPRVKPEQVAELLRSRVESLTGCTISLGLCRYKKGLPYREMIAQADHAMYTSKRSGKNRVTVV